mgnify:CR=1 FL=1
MGFSEVEVYAKMADSAPEIRAIVAGELGLKADLGLRKRSIEAKVLASWEIAGLREQNARQKKPNKGHRTNLGPSCSRRTPR